MYHHIIGPKGLRSLPLLLCCAAPSLTLAQSDNERPRPILTVTLTQDAYPEIFDEDSLRWIGDVLFNRNSRKVVAFRKEDRVHWIRGKDEQGPEGVLMDGTDQGDTARHVGVGRWLSLDPLATKYAGLSPYCFVGNMPIMAKDPDGRYIRLSFQDQRAYKAYVKLVNASLGGQFKIEFKMRTDDPYDKPFEVVLLPAKNGGDLSKMTERQLAFYKVYNFVATDKNIARMDVAWNDQAAEVGDWTGSIISMKDILAFDAGGPGGPSSAGALIHETVEQLHKSREGLFPGEEGREKDYRGVPKAYLRSHAKAKAAENHVNGNKRAEMESGDSDYFLEKDGTITKSTYSYGRDGLEILKKKVDKIE